MNIRLLRAHCGHIAFVAAPAPILGHSFCPSCEPTSQDSLHKRVGDPPVVGPRPYNQQENKEHGIMIGIASGKLGPAFERRDVAGSLGSTLEVHISPAHVRKVAADYGMPELTDDQANEIAAEAARGFVRNTACMFRGCIFDAMYAKTIDANYREVERKEGVTTR